MLTWRGYAAVAVITLIATVGLIWIAQSWDEIRHVLPVR
jgi:hypothetical protein